MAGGGDQAKREFDAMMKMRKIDVAVIEAARRGYPIDFFKSATVCCLSDMTESQTIRAFYRLKNFPGYTFQDGAPC
jgi:hypothetical protein